MTEITNTELKELKVFLFKEKWILLIKGLLFFIAATVCLVSVPYFLT